MDGSDILRDGTPWVPVGVNAMSCFGEAKPNSYPENVSVVREWVIMDKQPFYCCSGCRENYGKCWGAKQISTGSWLHPLEAILDRNAEEGVLTIVDLHKWDEGTDLWGKIPSQSAFYGDFINKLVYEYIPFLNAYPEAWLSIWNEPFAWDGSDNVGPEEWHAEMDAILMTIRNSGYSNVVMVPAGKMGQDESVLLSGHAKTLAETYGPVVFDLHVYNKWNTNTPAQLDARLQAIQDEGLAVIIGETGPSNAGHNLDPFPLIEKASRKSIGVLAWLFACDTNGNDKNKLKKPTSSWCQTWEWNDNDNFDWGSGFAHYLSENYVA